MIELALMQTLHAVARSGSISAAGDVLHITTSAVSQRLAKLEREVGQSMLERHGRGVRLTDAGRLLLGYAERILSLADEAEAELDGYRGAVVGKLSIAGFPSTVRGLLPRAVTMLKREYPQLRVELSEQEQEGSMPLVSRGDLDVAVVQDWFNVPLAVPDRLATKQLLEDVVDVALPAGHPLAERSVLDLEDLAQEVWITWSPGTGCHDWLLHTMRERGVEPRVGHTAGEHPTQLALVQAGFGVAVMPRLGRDQVPDGVRIVPVRPRLSRRVYAVWRQEAGRRPAVMAAVEMLATAARLVTQPDHRLIDGPLPAGTPSVLPGPRAPAAAIGA
ncbi:LysR family transcriptional regulator [Nonomuraea sp. NPDC050394]|uniref:LysR family transcriptional regulator n=1 Tax=Nonomuraea sp. NPDC050394 TaxID=3364363 RepID=UPI00379B899F